MPLLAGDQVRQSLGGSRVVDRLALEPVQIRQHGAVPEKEGRDLLVQSPNRVPADVPAGTIQLASGPGEGGVHRPGQHGQLHEVVPEVIEGCLQEVFSSSKSQSRRSHLQVDNPGACEVRASGAMRILLTTHPQCGYM
jgi:hypothetical protein